jgi:hypothetical protein
VKVVRLCSNAAVWILALFACGYCGVGSAEPSTSPANFCAQPQYHQFDFWIGRWEVFDIDQPGSPVAHVNVDRILGGCVVHERYDGVNGSHGESFSIYDASEKLWRQSWVTNRGKSLVIEGNWKAGEMILTGMDRSLGPPTQVQGIWKPVKGGIREVAVRSADRGQTWKPWFDLMFRPARNTEQVPPMPMAEDKKTILTLDRKYQAAVKTNDGGAMDQLLADDFLLVTGTGKTYTKADLLQEARSGAVTYERQEDREQSVRIYGNTAVITAKLWEKGMRNNHPFDRTLWFSDVYLRTASGWRYSFAQSSLPLPPAGAQ